MEEPKIQQTDESDEGPRRHSTAMPRPSVEYFYHPWLHPFPMPLKSPKPQPPLTLTIHGVRMRQHEHAIRSFSTSMTFQSFLRREMLIELRKMLHEGATGVYHAATGGYVALANFYASRSILEYPFGRPKTPVSSSTSSTDSDIIADKSCSFLRRTIREMRKRRKKAAKERQKPVWRAVYHRPLTDCIDVYITHPKTARPRKMTPRELLGEMVHSVRMLWAKTYVYPCVKCPLVYIEDLQAGQYAPTWRRRAVVKADQTWRGLLGRRKRRRRPLVGETALTSVL
ncbi:hypothetical protein TWF696_003042 [Orbilia brochopaga]|uniref:Uncharacterized protein n=1 Tax=Orbilia brochopaga TaxID=3140254 RepID=A0AAV9U1I4_9PEZI